MLIAEYQEYQDEFEWDLFVEIIEDTFRDRKFPVNLIAENSNWKGQTGYAEAKNINELISKIVSFDSDCYELHKIGHALQFKLVTHDVPTGFWIKVRRKT